MDALDLLAGPALDRADGPLEHLQCLRIFWVLIFIAVTSATAVLSGAGAPSILVTAVAAPGYLVFFCCFCGEVCSRVRHNEREYKARLARDAAARGN